MGKIELGVKANLGNYPKFVSSGDVQVRKMPRRSWGPTTKERARRFLEALLKCVNEDAPHSLEILEWEPSEAAKLIAKGQIRHFQELTRSGQQEPLTSVQIKKEVIPSLKELKIYEDKRLKKQGASDWEFSLQLWNKDTPQNITEFEKRWKEVRNQNLKAPLESSNSQGFELEDHLREFCTAVIKQKKQLTTNPLTSKDGVVGNLDDIHIPLALVERKKKPKEVKDIPSPEEGSRFYSDRGDYEITQEYEGEEFFQQILNPDNGGDKRFAIIGEPGAGKTTFLVKIADRILEASDIPIWISLAELEARTLEDYLPKIWLKNALKRVQEPTAEQQEALADLFQTGKVWLLLDGADEIAGNPLSAIAHQFRVSWIDSAKAVLTCRLNVWEGDRNALSNFKTYLTRNFQYPDRVQEFIDRWFQQPCYQDSQKTDLAESLKTELEQPEKARIRDLVTNPLRLTLLCCTWGRYRGGLPDTQAGLYQNFVKYFYLWKEEDNPKFKTTYEQRERLNLALGELAKDAIDSDRSRFRLFESQVCRFLGQPDSELFQLAIDLGWLNRVGVAEENPDQAVYAFYHPTFQEYFAACAIDDWDDFLPRTHVNCPVEGKKYRIFDPQWKQVILLWLGREDINDSQKEEFIQALVEFEDGCGYFYKYQAYFLAASGIHEFQKCSRALDIVRQIIKYRFGELNCENRRWNDGLLYPTKQELNKIITETIRHFVISELIDVFENCPRERIRTEVIESLSKIDPRNGKATTALVRLMEKTEDEYTCRWVAWSLGKVGLGNPQAIDTLIQLMEPTEDEGIRRQAVESLGEIGQGNPRAIAALIKFLENTGDESDQFIAAWSLGEIGQQDPKAIMALIQLINKTRDDDIERLAMWSLGTIGRKNYRAITALFQFLQPNQDEYTRCLAAEVLGKQIESNKKQAIDTLIELAQTTKNKCFIWNNVIPALAEIGNDNAKIVAILIEFIENSKNQMIRIYAILKLEKIGRNCHEAITILSRILESEKDENICKAAVYVLGEISHHNIRAINVLIQLFRMTQDKGMREMVIDSLSKIGQGNYKVIDNFIQILEFTEDEDICCDIAVSLGEIGRENPKAINALTKFLATAEDKYTRSTVALSLGKIDPGNILAINTLLEIIKINDSREVYSFCVAENFKLLLTQKKEFADVVSALRDPLNDEIENNITQHKNYYRIIWQCAQNLPYPDFYRAWHGDEATVPPAWEAQFSDRTQHPSILDIDATILDGEAGTDAIAATLCELIFEAAFPDEEIPEVENAPQLRKHLKTLKKRLQQPQLAILLRNCEPTSELIQFCRRLTRVIHIAGITDTPLEPPLQSIPTNHPNPQEAVLAWLSEHSS